MGVEGTLTTAVTEKVLEGTEPCHKLGRGRTFLRCPWLKICRQAEDVEER